MVTSQSIRAKEMAALYAGYATQAVLQPVADGKRLVPGAGPLDSPLVVVGEAPGAEEDRLGEPFVGPSGQLLQSLFAEAGLPWELCYRTNVLPWRPPGNRTPHNFEIVASYRRLEAEIDLVQPARVIAAGAVAWQCVSQGDLGSFAASRGQWFQVPWKDWAVMPVFHPAAILRASDRREQQQMRADAVAALRSSLALS